MTRTDSPDSPPQKQLILLVDDSDQTRAIYQSKLKQEGYAILEAASGAEALRLIQASRPDLVVLDLWMEDIDGFKILQHMGQDENLKSIPVIVLSARVVPTEVEKVMALGAKAHLPKMTTTPIKLVQKIRETLPIKK